MIFGRVHAGNWVEGKEKGHQSLISPHSCGFLRHTKNMLLLSCEFRARACRSLGSTKGKAVQVFARRQACCCLADMLGCCEPSESMCEAIRAHLMSADQGLEDSLPNMLQSQRIIGLLFQIHPGSVFRRNWPFFHDSIAVFKALRLFLLTA